jgi:MYXO-CTERM domain-containing protein
MRYLLLLLLPSEALAIDDVLMLGNSYIFTQSLDQELARLMEIGGHNTTVHALTAGGLTLSDHAEKAADPESEWYAALVTQASEREWVILQDQSQIPGFASDSEYWIDSLAGAETLNLLIETAAAETVFFLTWGRREGDSGNTSRYPDFATMQELLNQGYLHYQSATSTDDRPTWIAPVGPAYARIYADTLALGEDPLDPSALFWGLYSSDGSHPSPLGTYLAACVFYATLTGTSPAGLEAPSHVDAAHALQLQEAAATAVFEDTDWLSYPWQGASEPQDSASADTDADAPDAVDAGGDEDSGGNTVPAPCGCTTGVAGSGLFILGLGAATSRRRRQSS